jgi:fibronectin-binding autotransporter adhesin
MNINKVLKLGAWFALLTLILSVSGFAQTFVSATNGDDSFGTGTQQHPYRSITKAITVLAATGGTISVEAGIYNNGLTGETDPVTVGVAKTFTFVGTSVGVNTTVNITNGFVLSNAGAVVNMGLTGSAGFDLGSTANALVLTAGSMNIATGTAGAGVTLESGAQLTVTDGTLNAVPATGANLSVVFNGANAVSSTAAFLPSSLGTGSLTINKATGAITIDNATLATSGININNVAAVNISSAVTSKANIAITAAAAVNFSGNVTLGTATAGAAADLINSSTGTTTVGAGTSNTLTLFTTVDGGTVGTDANVSEVKNTSTGKIVVNSIVTENIKNTGTSGNAGDLGAQIVTLPLFSNTGNGAAAITVNGDVNFVNANVRGTAAGDNQVSHTVTLSNIGTGTVTFNGSILTPISTAAFTTPANVAISVKLSNVGGGTFATRSAALRGTAGIEGISNKTNKGTMTLGQSGDVITAAWDIMNDVALSSLTINATGTFAGALTNNNATSVVTFGAAQAIAGAVINTGAMELKANVSMAGTFANGGNVKLNANTLTLSGNVAGVLSGAGDIFSATTAVAGSGSVKFTGAAPTSTYTGRLPNVEFANATSFSLAGNVVWGNAVKSGAGTLTFVAASDIKGNFTMTGAGLVTVNGALVVRGDVNMTAGDITLGTAGLTVEGTVNIPQGTFTFGANTLTLLGDFNRTGGTIDATAAGTGVIQFTGAKSQNFQPGTQMNVGSVIVNSTGQYTPPFVTNMNIITFQNSLIVKGDFTITAGLVALGTNNIRMAQTATGGPGTTARFTNNGRGYTVDPANIGGIIFEGSGANAAGAGDGSVITGSQPFSNVFVRLQTASNNVFALGSVVISGVVTLDKGGIIWNTAADAGDAFNTSTLTLDQSLTGTLFPTVVINTVNTHGSPFLVGGAVPLAITTFYNLNYTGNTSVAMQATDFVTGKVNNLAIINGGSGKTIQGLNAASTIAGNLQVDALDALNLANGGAQVLTLSSNTGTHVVNGTVTGGTVLVTGTGATLTGGVGTVNASSVSDLQIAPATAGTFTATGMKVLEPLTINQAAVVANITMNSATATVNNFTNTAGSTILNMNSTVVNATGNYSVAAGSVTLTMNGAAFGTATIGGTLGVTGGTLTLGSNLWVTGAVTHTGTSLIALGAFNLTLADAYTHNNTATFSASTGKVVAAPAAVKAYTMTTTVSIPNFEVNAAGTVQLATAGLTVSNAYTQTAGTVDLNSLPLTISGNTFTFVAGTYSNTGAAATGVIELQGTAAVVNGNGSPTIPYLKINTTGTVTINPTTASPAVARTITVTGLFTQTKGALSLGINKIMMSGAGNFTFVAGSIAATTGTIEMNTAGGVLTPGTLTSLSIPNLVLTGNTTVAGTDTLHVSKSLVISADLALATDGRLILDDGVAITRTTTNTLSNLPQFAGVVDVTYTTNAISTAKELPTSATALRTLTINDAAGAPSVTLTANATVNGTLALTQGQLALGGKTLTIATGATVNVKAGTLSAALTPAGAYKLIYSGGSIATSLNEWPAAATVSDLSVTVTSGSTLSLSASKTVGTFTLNTADATGIFSLGANTLTVTGISTLTKGQVTGTGTLVAQGDVNAAGATFASTVNMSFTGGASQTITTPTGGASVGNITINKTLGTNIVTIAGGDLTCVGTVTFNNGLIMTDATHSLVLAPTQGTALLGFVRALNNSASASHVVGNVKEMVKFSNLVAFARNEFPVGDSLGNYRPAALTFVQTGGGSGYFGINVTVRETSAKPTGRAGLPIANGIAPGIDISGYPSFFWSIIADGSFGATAFNLELAAAGFDSTEINLTDVGLNLVKMIRRGGTATDITNQWNLQGTPSSYDNLVSAGVPHVTAVNAVGGLSTGGAIFTYGLKSNLVLLNAIAAQTLTAGAATFVRDLNTPPVFSGNVGPIVYSATSSNTSIATVAVVGSTLTVTPVGAGNATITVTGTDNQGQINTSFAVTVNPGAVAVSGKVVYDNPATTGIGRATVTLTPATGTVLQATADTAGVYTFANVPAGSYTLSAVKTGTWAGANATDALLAVRAYAGLQTLDALATAAADVNNSGSVNATDALLIVQRFAGVINAFAKGDWTFSQNVISVGSTSMTNQVVKGLAVGDVNKSNTTTGASFQKAVSNVVVNAGKSANVVSKATFALPVRAGSSMTLGAVSLRMNYPADLVTFTGVASTKLSGVVAAANDGVITIGWANMDTKLAGAAVTENDVLLSLNFVAKVDKGSVSLTAGAGSEFADVNGSIIANANVSADAAEVGAAPSTFELAQNYPNPFNPSTEISYSIAAPGKVTLAIYNVMGQEVSRLVSGQQEAGVYKVRWNASGMASGVYVYRLQVDDKFTASKRLTLLK